MKQKIKGSVLAYSMIILFVMLSIVLSMSAVAIKDRNSAGTTGDSVQAFQTANSGSEIFLKNYKNLVTTNPSISSMTSSNWSPMSCDNASGNLTGSNYSIMLKDSSGTLINCKTPGSAKISDIAKIQVNGSYGGSTRAIEVAMAASCSDASIDLKSNINAPFQNTTGKKLLIVAAVHVTSGTPFTAYVNSTSTGITVAANIVAGMGISSGVSDRTASFVVPPSYYYQMNFTGGPIYQIQGWQLCSN